MGAQGDDTNQLRGTIILNGIVRVVFAIGFSTEMTPINLEGRLFSMVWEHTEMTPINLEGRLFSMV